MTVNVYTYYEKKLALQEASKKARQATRMARRRPPLGPLAQTGVLLGLLVALSMAALEPTAPLEALVAGCTAWGLVCGICLEWLAGRLAACDAC